MSVMAFDTALTAAPFEVIRDQVMPKLPTATPDAIDATIREVLQEFFKKSTIWRTTVGPLTVRANRQEVPIPPTASSEPGQVLRVWFGDRWLAAAANVSDPTSDPADPTHYATPSPDVVVLWPQPRATERKLTVYLSLLPDRTYYSLPKFVVTHWLNEIIDGVLGKMYTSPMKPYTDPSLAQLHLRRFQDGIAAARHYAEHGGQRHATGWKFPGFA